MSDYFVIDGRDDDPYVARMTKKELSQALIDGRFGEGFIDIIQYDSQQICHFGDDKVLIIRGSIVVPKAREAVTVWDVG